VRLPHADQAVIDPRKIRDYLLSPEHPVGRFKAHFFERLGFTKENWGDFRVQVSGIAQRGEAEVGQRTDYGQKYIVRGSIVSKVGRSARVRTIWIVLHDEEMPRFVTAVPEW
jgi:hypothetical protein